MLGALHAVATSGFLEFAEDRRVGTGRPAVVTLSCWRSRGCGSHPSGANLPKQFRDALFHSTLGTKARPRGGWQVEIARSG